MKKCNLTYLTILISTFLLIGATAQANEIETKFVEAGLVRLAAEKASKEQIARLKAALKSNEDSIDDSLAFYETDRAFHRLLYDVVDNPVFPAIHTAFSDWLDVRWRQMPRDPERNRTN